MSSACSLDLGELKAPVLIFGGCYSNLQATQALQDWAEKNKFLPEQCVCTGDIVAYCGNPYETVELIRDWGVHCIQGNVEQSLAMQSGDCGCGFDAGTVCDILSRGWYPIAEDTISQSQRNWFASLPEQLHFSISDQSVNVVHGAVSDINRFMFASQPESDFLDEFALLNITAGTEVAEESNLIIAGHSGLPFTKKIAQKYWHNSGALGMPANDGTQDVWFSILDVIEGEIKIKHQRLEYKVNLAYEEMLKNNLTQGYHEALKTGLWPSMDVLPEVEKQQQGKMIEEF